MSNRSFQHKILHLNIYPVKSCGRVALDEMVIDEYGPKWDRKWMLVDQQGQFFSQRKTASLCKVQVDLVDYQLGQFSLSFPGQKSIEISPKEFSESTMPVQIWRDNLSALVGPTHLNDWFSKVVGEPCTVVQAERGVTDRRVKPKHGGAFVQFADGYPLLLVSAESIGRLNEELDSQISLHHFRGNIVVSSQHPFEENSWQELKMSDGFQLNVVKPCTRCVMINIDQETGQKKEQVFKAVGRLNRIDGKVIFGQNLVHLKPGGLNVGTHFQLNQKT